MRKQLLPPALLGLMVLIAAGSATARTIETDPVPGPGDFSITIDNKYWPLPVNTSFAYRAETEDGCEYNKLTVTSQQYAVQTGHTTLVIRDQEWEDEDCEEADEDPVLVEDTQDYHAQEIATGHVWYFGEETYALPDEGAACDDGGSWEAGLPIGDLAAKPGIIMLGAPMSGDRYQQELLEDEAEDWGAVLRLNAKVSAYSEDYEDCLITREWTPLEPGEIEHKFYCAFEGDNPGPGGLMFIEELKGKTVYVEYIGSDFSVLGIGPLPGEDDVYPLGGGTGADGYGLFPSDDLGCTP
jgi:hypothetical protein